MTSLTFDIHPGRIRSGWNLSTILRGKRLTDARIAYYQRRGFYSDEFRAARREHQQRQQSQRSKRDGSFVIHEGRAIYSP